MRLIRTSVRHRKPSCIQIGLSSPRSAIYDLQAAQLSLLLVVHSSYVSFVVLSLFYFASCASEEEKKSKIATMARRKFIPIFSIYIFIILQGTASRSYYVNSNDTEKEATPHARENNYADSGSMIVFPDSKQFDLQARGDGRNAIMAPVSICQGQTFCEDVSNYPKELVNRALATDSSLIHYANVDAVDFSVVQRIDSIEEQPLCLTLEKLIRPRSGETINREWLYIVQSAESNFTQVVRVEICGEEGSTCKIIDGFAEGYTTTCKQKFIYRQLSAISKDGEIIRDFFRFPASCCCHVQFAVEDTMF